MKQTLTQYFQNLPIPWLVGGPVGHDDVTAYGTVMDGQVDLIKQAVKARMPGLAPSDALPHIGNDSQLIKGPHETDISFRIRLRDRWDDWARAGTNVELLAQLFWGEFPGAVIVQQNGLAYNLSGALTPGVDPTSSLVVTTLGQNWGIAHGPPQPVTVTISTGGALGTMQFKTTVNGVQSSAIPSAAADAEGFYAYQIPGTVTWLQFDSGTYVLNSTYVINVDNSITLAGGAIDKLRSNSTPWWIIDTKDYFCSRFLVLFPGPTFPPSLTTHARATFTGVESSIDVTWNNPFDSLGYHYMVGAPTVTSGPVASVALDPASKSLTGGTLVASGPFTGFVDVIAWQDGANPYADFHQSDLARLRQIIATWRHGNATCAGIYCVAQGGMWDWPVEKWDGGVPWGYSDIVKYDA